MVKVSVLVPIYNVEKYLEKCLESLCNQTLKEIEIICIDDGSTDKSRTILENFKERDQRIIVIEKVNTGYGNSMNIGLDKAIGKYIVIVESDDFVELDMVEKLYIEAEISKADVIKSNCFFYSENYKGERDLFINLFEDMPLKKAFCPIKEPRIFLKPQTIWSGIYVREFLLDNNIWFNETPGASYQDVSFSFQVLARASKIWLLPEAYYHYRTGNLNSSVKSPNKVFCICDEIDKIDEFIERQSQNKSILKWIESRLGYRVLMERYYGLASAFQYALFLKIVKYLEEYKKSGYITGEIWDKESIEEVDKILENPNKYFMDTAKSFEDERIVDEKSFTLNYSLYGNAVLKKVLGSEKVIIYGSGQVGKEFLKYLLENNYRKNNICFAVTDSKENENCVDGIPVLGIKQCQEWKEAAIVVVAVKEQNQFEIIQNLERLSFKEVVAVDQMVRCAIKESIQ